MGETEQVALARELHEEVGVRVGRTSSSPLCRLTVRPAGDLVLLSAWLVHEWQGTPVNGAPEEHDDLGWFDLETLPPLAHELVRSTLSAAAGPRGG